METQKLLIRLYNEHNGATEYVHLVYIDTGLYREYFSKNKTADIGAHLSAWVKEDFGVSLAMSSINELRILKELVFDRCKTAYPELYCQDSNRQYDRQGWMRFWISKKMREELNTDGKLRQ